MVRVAKQQNSVSIADFIAGRYGKSQAVAALVAVAAFVILFGARSTQGNEHHRILNWMSPTGRQNGREI